MEPTPAEIKAFQEWVAEIDKAMPEQYCQFCEVCGKADTGIQERFSKCDICDAYFCRSCFQRFLPQRFDCTKKENNMCKETCQNCKKSAAEHTCSGCRTGLCSACIEQSSVDCLTCSICGEHGCPGCEDSFEENCLGELFCPACQEGAVRCSNCGDPINPTSQYHCCKICKEPLCDACTKRNLEYGGIVCEDCPI